MFGLSPATWIRIGLIAAGAAAAWWVQDLRADLVQCTATNTALVRGIQLKADADAATLKAGEEALAKARAETAANRAAIDRLLEMASDTKPTTCEAAATAAAATFRR